MKTTDGRDLENPSDDVEVYESEGSMQMGSFRSPPYSRILAQFEIMVEEKSQECQY